ncbi:hypothetical protein M2352_000802 [Azospirillum fermentarium]|uniref:DUF2249 domain-containing protein n=1 Tax=Azospirillum fermentarium TaxID=1233114 RepID=UPI0022267607|nr:DUF2249 domain-containing protein [Azospirillum fermentarium]MCW2245211.1 hypothetical protein [Azospirillum fermentarium]
MTTPSPAADWFAQADTAAETVRIDVRPALAAGTDPFVQVMDGTTRVEPGGFLVIDAPFDPAPLRRVLAGKGFASQGREVAPGHWRICCRREGGGSGGAPSPLPRLPGEVWQEGAVVHIDVRGMTPPGPLHAVLRLMEREPDRVVIAHLDRDPVLLYAEAESRGWERVGVSTIDGEVRVVLRRAAPPPSDG